MKFKILLLQAILIYSTNLLSYSGLVDPETTRTKSMAGAGVGSILLNESSLLNPASIVFFDKSSFYFQNDEDKLKERSETRTNDYRESSNKIILITDTSSAVHGGLSYQYQRENSGKRVRYSTSLATNLGKKTALGLIYRYSQEESLLVNKTYNQIVLGTTHIPYKDFVIGATIVDPSQTTAEYFKYTLGVQYTLNSFINLIFDIGSGDIINKEEESFTRWALQLQSFKRVFFRYGQFHDKMINQKGSAFGISWVGPRFSMDFSNKISGKILDLTDTILQDEQINESSVALTVLF